MRINNYETINCVSIDFAGMQMKCHRAGDFFRTKFNSKQISKESFRNFHASQAQLISFDLNFLHNFADKHLSILSPEKEYERETYTWKSKNRRKRRGVASQIWVQTNTALLHIRLHNEMPK